VSDELIAAISAANPDLQIERNAEGDLILMPPSGLSGGGAEAELIGQLRDYVRRRGGRCFSSTAGFTLPNGALRSPDAAYVSAQRWQELPHAERQSFGAIVPDVTFELRSPSERLADVRRKLAEYIDCGVTMAVLLDARRRVVEIRRRDGANSSLHDPARVVLGPPLEGFELDVESIFELARE
jgi:Uma2 family endonuclease